MSEPKIREIYRGRVVRLVTESLTLPNGKAVTLEMVRHPGAAAIVPVNDAREVLLIRQYRHAAGGFIYEIPAGKLDKGEPPEKCADRELTEEAGVVAGKTTRLGSIVTTPGFTDEVIHLFLAEDLRPAKTSHEPDEVITTLRRPLQACLDMVARGEIIDGKSICALFLADRMIRERG